MKNLHIFAYNNASKSSKSLAKSLKISRIHHKNSKLIPRITRTIINWGTDSVNFPIKLLACNIVNIPTAIDTCSNKLLFFQHLKNQGGILHPSWTTSFKEASQWQQDSTIVGRKTLRGHSGRGIIFLKDDNSNIEEWGSCPLWTKYIPKKDEFRVHFGFKKIIDVQQKRRKVDIPDDQVNWRVRSFHNGFVYTRENLQYQDEILAISQKVIDSINLDFGAIDIIWNEKKQKAYVLEVNTAPGLEGHTIEIYKQMFEENLP